MKSENNQHYTEIHLEYYKADMIHWCRDNIPGTGDWFSDRVFVLDIVNKKYSWYAGWPRFGLPGIVFKFAREEDATLFLLRWS